MLRIVTVLIVTFIGLTLARPQVEEEVENNEVDGVLQDYYPCPINCKDEDFDRVICAVDETTDDQRMFMGNCHMEEHNRCQDTSKMT